MVALRRTGGRGLVVGALLVAMPAVAGPAPDQKPVSSPTSSGAPSSTLAGGAAAVPAAVMQVKREITGDLTYRIVTARDQSFAPAPLPAASGTDGIVALAIPESMRSASGTLEVLDNTRGNLARVPITTSGVASLTETSFQFAQRIDIPVQA